MRYFKNSELVRLYNVSDKTVRNWIAATETGKLELELFTAKEGKTFIVDTLKNEHILDILAKRSKKYRNQRTHRHLRPSQELYDLFSQEQILNIVDNLEKHNEFPLQYRYFGRGANIWDDYAKKLSTSPKPNTLGLTIDALHLDTGHIDSIIESYKYVNVIDIGVGNALPVRQLLTHLHGTGKLKRYAGIDASSDMLDVAERNISKWFNGQIVAEKCVKDIAYERFGEILKQSSFGDDASSTINLILFLGGTLTNFREPSQALQTIYESMGKNDLLLTSLKLDSENARRFFDFNTDVGPDKGTPLAAFERFGCELLGIDDSLYEVEQFYTDKQKTRFIQIRLKTSISLHFKVGDYQKTLEFQKGDKIICLRVLHFSPYELIELYRQNGLGLIQAVTSENQEYMLMISRIMSDITK